MTCVLLLQQRPLLAVGIRATLLEYMNGCQVQSARQDPLVLEQLLETARPDVTVFDDTDGTVIELLDLLGRQRVQRLGMAVVVTANHRSEETLFQLAMWGVAAYVSANMAQEAFAETVRRVSEGEWMLSSEGMAQPSRRLQPEKQREAAPASAQTSCQLLSQREIEVLGHVARGKSNKEIALLLFLSDQTVKNHMTSIYKKLAVTDRTAAVVSAFRRELIKLPAGPDIPVSDLYASVA